MTDEPSAVLLTVDDRETYRAAAAIVAAETGEPNADALHRLAKSGGFAVELADRCSFLRNYFLGVGSGGISSGR